MSSNFDGLTDSQRKCLILVAQGASSKEIALTLKLSNHTVDNYLHRATRIIGAENRREAAKIYAVWHRDLECKQFILKSPTLATQPGSGMINGSQPDGPSHPDVDREVARTARDEKADSSMKLVDVVVGRPLPLGGKVNDLTAKQRLAVILRLSLFSLISMTAIILVAKGAFSLFS